MRTRKIQSQRTFCRMTRNPSIMIMQRNPMIRGLRRRAIIEIVMEEIEKETGIVIIETAEIRIGIGTGIVMIEGIKIEENIAMIMMTIIGKNTVKEAEEMIEIGEEEMMIAMIVIEEGESN